MSYVSYLHNPRDREKEVSKQRRVKNSRRMAIRARDALLEGLWSMDT